MPSLDTQERMPGSLAAAISNHVVRLFSEYTGRGPTRPAPSSARTSWSPMRDDVVGAVEVLTGRRVISFMSDHDAETDHAAEIFVLDGEPALNADGEPAIYSVARESRRRTPFR